MTKKEDEEKYALTAVMTLPDGRRVEKEYAINLATNTIITDVTDAAAVELVNYKRVTKVTDRGRGIFGGFAEWEFGIDVDLKSGKGKLSLKKYPKKIVETEETVEFKKSDNSE